MYLDDYDLQSTHNVPVYYLTYLLHLSTYVGPLIQPDSTQEKN